MAGAAGFEPTNGGTKNRCLTAWLRPNPVVTCARRTQDFSSVRAYSGYLAKGNMGFCNIMHFPRLFLRGGVGFSSQAVLPLANPGENGQQLVP